MHLRFRAFRAIHDQGTCMKFVEEHRNVLKDYGIMNITTNNDVWMHNPNIYCVVAESIPDYAVVGGVRIQVSDENTPLPVELAIGRMDPAIYDLVKNFRVQSGIGELCALWNARKVAGIGISLLLIRAAIAASGQLPLSRLISICADYTLNMFQQVGFIVNDNLGTNGSFPYPNATYTARVLGIMNSQNLENARSLDKLRMTALREQPVQTFVEEGVNQQITIDYNLVILN